MLINRRPGFFQCFWVLDKLYSCIRNHAWFGLKVLRRRLKVPPRPLCTVVLYASSGTARATPRDMRTTFLHGLRCLP